MAAFFDSIIMQHIQLSIEANELQQEYLIGILSQFDATGFEQTPTHILAYFEENNFENNNIKDALKNFQFQMQTLKEQNWNNEWERNFQPVLVGDFCAIRADFHQPIQDVQHEIIITPKMSFGTGHHATTYMMIDQMKDIDFKNKKVFDFGTGTGILAILAEKMGAAKVSAIDIDEWSINNAVENIAMNNCNKIYVTLDTILPDEKFDVFLANINRNVILQYIPQIKNCLLPNGYLLLSGLLTSDEKDIVEAFEKNQFQLMKQTTRTNWISLLFVNGNS